MGVAFILLIHGAKCANWSWRSLSGAARGRFRSGADITKDAELIHYGPNRRNRGNVSAGTVLMSLRLSVTGPTDGGLWVYPRTEDSGLLQF